MRVTFNELITILRDLPLQEKMEVKNIVERSIIDEKRKEIHKFHLQAKAEYKRNKLIFSNDIDKLKSLVD